jgi:hypothetical protein
MSKKPPDIEAIRKVIRDSTEDLKVLVENPEILDNWTPVQIAWTKEQLELMIQEAKRVEADIRKLIEKKKTGG